ncbi:MAG TPA: hypothetical protein VGN98_00635 [Tianweitania sediminis]|jgi:hypothetical protein|nr:hypothetical protein [Tianweitania sediminis]
MTRFKAGRIACLAPVLLASALASGCLSSPTYGTDKTANEQLYEDLTGMFAVGGSRDEPIDYKPRPELVRPAPGATPALPPPQQSVASVEGGQWPESPEQRRARIRAEATANQDNPNYRPEVVPDVALSQRARQPLAFGRENEIPQNGTESNARVQREEFNRRLADQRQGNPTTRKYLSEPPLDYRAPAPTAPVGDVGEDEAVKERRAKAAARKSSGTNSWRDILPF